MKKVALLLMLVCLLVGCDQVSYIEKIVLINPTDYDLVVDAKGAKDDPWLPLGIAKRNAETSSEQVVDQGESWILRFSYAGTHVSEDRVTRESLVGDRWRYEIPAEVGVTLKAKGFPASGG